VVLVFVFSSAFVPTFSIRWLFCLVPPFRKRRSFLWCPPPTRGHRVVRVLNTIRHFDPLMEFGEPCDHEAFTFFRAHDVIPRDKGRVGFGPSPCRGSFDDVAPPVNFLAGNYPFMKASMSTQSYP